MVAFQITLVVPQLVFSRSLRRSSLSALLVVPNFSYLSLSLVHYIGMVSDFQSLIDDVLTLSPQVSKVGTARDYYAECVTRLKIGIRPNLSGPATAGCVTRSSATYDWRWLDIQPQIRSRDHLCTRYMAKRFPESRFYARLGRPP